MLYYYITIYTIYYIILYYITIINYFITIILLIDTLLASLKNIIVFLVTKILWLYKYIRVLFKSIVFLHPVDVRSSILYFYLKQFITICTSINLLNLNTIFLRGAERNTCVLFRVKYTDSNQYFGYNVYNGLISITIDVIISCAAL